jgi:hypothetical protein
MFSAEATEVSVALVVSKDDDNVWFLGSGQGLGQSKANERHEVQVFHF